MRRGTPPTSSVALEECLATQAATLHASSSPEMSRRTIRTSRWRPQVRVSVLPLRPGCGRATNGVVAAAGTASRSVSVLAAVGGGSSGPAGPSMRRPAGPGTGHNEADKRRSDVCWL